MDLKAQLQSDLKDAMRNRQETRKSTIRLALLAIQLAEVEKRARLDDAGYLLIIQKEIKARKEAIADAERANRAELIPQNEEEIKVLQGYLPAALTEAELESLARVAISDTGASSIREMGMVMKILMPRLQGRATGEQASTVVRRLLQ